MSRNTLPFITFSVCWVFIEKHHIVTISPLMCAELFFHNNIQHHLTHEVLAFLSFKGMCDVFNIGWRGHPSAKHVFHGHVLKTKVILLRAFIHWWWYHQRSASWSENCPPQMECLVCDFSIRSRSWRTWCRQIGTCPPWWEISWNCSILWSHFPRRPDSSPRLYSRRWNQQSCPPLPQARPTHWGELGGPWKHGTCDCNTTIDDGRRHRANPRCATRRAPIARLLLSNTILPRAKWPLGARLDPWFFLHGVFFM